MVKNKIEADRLYRGGFVPRARSIVILERHRRLLHAKFFLYFAQERQVAHLR